MKKLFNIVLITLLCCLLCGCVSDQNLSNTLWVLEQDPLTGIRFNETNEYEKFRLILPSDESDILILFPRASNKYEIINNELISYDDNGSFLGKWNITFENGKMLIFNETIQKTDLYRKTNKRDLVSYAKSLGYSLEEGGPGA